MLGGAAKVRVDTDGAVEGAAGAPAISGSLGVTVNVLDDTASVVVGGEASQLGEALANLPDGTLGLDPQPARNATADACILTDIAPVSANTLADLEPEGLALLWTCDRLDPLRPSARQALRDNTGLSAWLQARGVDAGRLDALGMLADGSALVLSRAYVSARE